MLSVVAPVSPFVISAPAERRWRWRGRRRVGVGRIKVRWLHVSWLSGARIREPIPETSIWPDTCLSPWHIFPIAISPGLVRPHATVSN